MSGSLIPFANIPSNVRVPFFYAEFSNVAAGGTVPNQRRLIIGQTINAVAAVPTYVPSLAWAQATFGARSQLAAQIAAYRANDATGELWALPLADGSGATAATGTIAVTGTATANGTLWIYAGCVPGQSGAVSPIQVGVSSGDTATVIAGNIATAMAAAPYLPFTAAAATGTVTLTAANKGTLGNDIPIVLNFLGAEGGQATPAGVTIAITAFTGGATDPSLSTIATILGNQAFDFIYSAYSDATSLGDTTAMMNDATGRWSFNQALYGGVFTAHSDTVANLLTYGALLNDQHLTVLGVNQASPTPPWIWGPAFMAQFAVSSVNQPNQPVQTLVLRGVLPAPSASDFTFTQQQSLLSTGIAVAAYGSGGVAQIVRAVTTYQKNSGGQPDTSYLDTETMFTLMAVVRQLKGAVVQKFPRALIADDGTKIPVTPPGDVPVIVTPGIIKAELVAQYAQLVDAGLCDDTAAFTTGLIVQRNANDNTRVDVLFDPYLVSGLRIFAVLTQFHLQALQAAA